MAAEYNYSSTAVATTLSGGVDGSDTTINVVSTSGFPTAPFKVTLDPDTASEEIVKVTAVVGLALTVTRGHDGTVGLSHSAGAAVRHQVTGEDLRLSREHEDAVADVHGIGATSDVVGTLTAQTLEGKTITSADNTLTIDQADVTGLVAALAAKIAASAVDDSWESIIATAAGSGWSTALAAVLGTGWANLLDQAIDDTSLATLLTNGLGSNWSSAMQTNLGSGWGGVLDGDVGSGWDAALPNALSLAWAFALGTDLATMRPTQTVSSTDITGVTGSSFAAGSPVVGHSFVAPPSGQVYVTVSGYIETTTVTEFAVLSWRLGTGGTVGAGTETSAPSDNRAVIAGSGVDTSAPIAAGGSNRFLITGLVAGDTYNVQTMHYITAGGTMNIYYRGILVEPVL